MALATVAAPRTDANAFRLMTWTLIPSCDAALVTSGEQRDNITSCGFEVLLVARYSFLATHGHGSIAPQSNRVHERLLGTVEDDDP